MFFVVEPDRVFWEKSTGRMTMLREGDMVMYDRKSDSVVFFRLKNGERDILLIDSIESLPFPRGANHDNQALILISVVTVVKTITGLNFVKITDTEDELIFKLNHS